jgi:hypothetical protein
MMTIFLIIFIVLVVLESIENKEAYIYFSRLISYLNSLATSKKSPVSDHLNHIEIEFSYGKDCFGIILPKRNPLKWVEVRALKNGKWVNKTNKLLYFAGPYKNFYGTAITPQQISDKYEKLAFGFIDGSIVHVQKNSPIMLSFKKFFSK